MESIKAEMGNVRVGAQGEKEAAYHIDFRLKDSGDWAVFHDLRLEHKGRVAQIDHLLISRTFEIFVIESKNVKTALRINGSGESEVKARWGWIGMASPVEQNKRHIQVLSALVDDYDLAPTRLGIRLSPTYRNWILFPPTCNFSRKPSEEATILKMDMFDRGLDEHIGTKSFQSVFAIAKFCSSETVMEFAYKLLRRHRPITFDYAAKFGVVTKPRPVSEAKPSVSRGIIHCESCEAEVEPKVVSFCRANEKRFAGKILCRSCQTNLTVKPTTPAPSTVVSASSCNQCHTPVEAKVIAFCRFNSRRFGKQILCRNCQLSVAVAVR